MCRQMFIFALLLAAPATAAQVGDPLGKVFELMGTLKAKITAEGEAEAKAFKDYVAWCDDASANLHNEIKTGGLKQEELEATISKCKADIEASSVKIEDLSGAISSDEKELKAATNIRNKEVATFKASEKELTDAIDVVGRAVGVLQKEMGGASFAQVDTTRLDSVLKGLSAVINAASFSSNDQAKLTALVQERQQSDSDDEELGAPAAAVYESHSTGIFDVLEDMKEKAESQLNDLRKAESTASHNYNMLKQSLVDEISADNKDMDEEKSLKAASEENKAVSSGDLEETIKELAKDKASLAEASTTCMTVAADHESTMRSRAEELGAIATALKILKESTGGAQAQSSSFLQLRSRTDMKNVEVVTLVKKLARAHHSAALAQLASRIKAVMAYGTNDDVFAKIRGLISDMISKLEKEAESEASEKAYCDEELAKTSDKKGELEGVVTKLTSKIDLAAAKSAELKSEVKVLSAELATLAKEQAEMDGIRGEEQAAYSKAKSELEAGIAGVQKATGVLKDYYDGAAFLQKGGDFDAFMQQPAQPTKHAKSGGAGGSIISILEVCEADFSKNLADEETQEADAIAVYEKTTQDNKLATTMKSQDSKYKTKEYKGLDKSISDLSGERDNTNTELSAVNDYFAKLKGRCIAKPESYGERKARREAEISGLKEALNILESETAFMQRGKHGHRHHHFMG